MHRALDLLDVDTTVRAAAVAVARARARAASVAMTAGVVRAGGVLAVVGTQAIAVGKSDDGRDEEEDDVDDAQRPASLEHGARLVGGPVIVGAGDGDVAETIGPVGAAADRSAVDVADAAQVVDTGDEGAEDEDVDDTDEEGVGRGAVVGEESKDGPGEGDDGDDEEDEDGGWGEGVCVVEAIYEPGEHAHDRDQSDDLKDPIKDEDDCKEHGGGVSSNWLEGLDAEERGGEATRLRRNAR